MLNYPLKQLPFEGGFINAIINELGGGTPEQLRGAGRSVVALLATASQL